MSKCTLQRDLKMTEQQQIMTFSFLMTYFHKFDLKQNNYTIAGDLLDNT